MNSGQASSPRLCSGHAGLAVSFAIQSGGLAMTGNPSPLPSPARGKGLYGLKAGLTKTDAVC